MIIYDRLRVIDGDTIQIRLWPSRLVETCRIEGLDTDEINTERGKRQKLLLDGFGSGVFLPYVFAGYSRSKFGKKRKRDAYGRLLVRVHVWRRWRYVNYADYMKRTGNVKKGSKWND